MADIKYNIDAIDGNERFKLARIKDSYLLSPISLSIINYAHIAKIHQLQTENDIEELWFRINYLRNFGFEMWPAVEGKVHVFEPLFEDVLVHKGLILTDTPYLERKRWINQTIDFFITNNRQMSESAKLQKVTTPLLQQRDNLMDVYVQNETGIKTQEAPRQAPIQPSNNTTASETTTNNPHLKNQDNVPQDVVNTHNAIMLKIALERAANGLSLSPQQKILVDEHNEKMRAKIASEKAADDAKKEKKQPEKDKKPVKKVSTTKKISKKRK